jgi:hypothetical protein
VPSRRRQADESTTAKYGCGVEPTEHVEADLVVETRDLKRFFAYLWRRRANRPAKRFRVLMLIGLEVVLILGIVSGGGGQALVAIGGAAVFFYAQHRVQRATRACSQEMCEGRFVGDSAGMTLFGRTGETTAAPWTAFIEIAPTTDHIFLVVADLGGYVLPRVCFEPGDDERLIAFARAARLRPPPAT